MGEKASSCAGSQNSHSAPFEDALSEGIEQLLEQEFEQENGENGEKTGEAQFESFTTDMDGLLAAISDGLPTPSHLAPATVILSATELDSSRKIRKKYGVAEEDGDYAQVIRGPDGRRPGREVSIIHETMQSLVGLFQEDLVEEGTIEDDHPLLPPFLALIEIALQHGWRSAPASLFSRPIRLWELVRKVEKWTKIPEAKMAIENISQLTLLRKSSSRVKAWIRLAIMGKTLSSDLTLILNNEGPFISQCYERWAFVRSDSFQPFLALISSLDAIDFNLFVKEAEIPKQECSYSWRRLFEGGRLNFGRLSPPIPVPDMLSTKSLVDSQSSFHSRSPSAITYSGGEDSHESWDQRFKAIQEDNLRLRRSLISQINQRAYFQEEYCKSQRKCAAVLQEQHSLKDEIASLQKRIRDLLSLVESHEHTNEALQRQLANAFAEQEESTDQGLVRRLRATINDLSEQLEVARVTFRQEKDQREQLEVQLSHAKDRHERQLQDLQERLNSSELSWSDRTKTLHDQLKIANCLKEEYKKRLQLHE